MRVLENTDIEKKKIIEMWEYCFSDPQKFIDWNFEHNFKAEQTYVAERDGEICANLQLMPYRVKLLGSEMDSVYVSGVATLPHYRNRGCIRELMEESLCMLNENKIPLCHLIPFNFGFYEKFGFTAVSERCTLKIQLDKIPYSCGQKFNMYSISDISEAVIDRLDLIYNEMCKNLNFHIIRQKENWQKILYDVLSNSEGYLAVSDEAYLLYGFEGENIDVYELGYSNPNGFRAALGFLKAHSAQSKAAEIITLDTPLIKAELCDIPDIRSTRPFSMLRITDALYILKIIAKRCKSKFTIKIIDDIIASNNGIYEIKDGSAEKTVQITSETTIDVTAHISAFSALIGGYLGIYDAVKLGLINVNSNSDAARELSEILKVSAYSNSFINLML